MRRCVVPVGLDRNAEAADLASQTLLAAAQQLGPTHPVTLEALNDTARFLDRSGRTAEAVGFGEQVLALRRATLGDGHPKTLTSWSNLIGYRFGTGTVDDEDLSELLSAWYRTDPELVDRAHLSALVLAADIRRGQAAALECTARLAELAGPDHPDTLRAGSLARSLAGAPTEVHE